MATEHLRRQFDELLDEIGGAADNRDWETVEDLAIDVLELDPNCDAARDHLRIARRRQSYLRARAARSQGRSRATARIGTERSMAGKSLPHGARVCFFDDGVALVKQTVKRSARFVIDGDGAGAQRERHVDPGDDRALGEAVRLAGEGRL